MMTAIQTTGRRQQTEDKRPKDKNWFDRIGFCGYFVVIKLATNQERGK